MRIRGQADEFGTVSPGELANLLVVRGKSLVDLDAINDVPLVMRDGVT